MLSILLIPAAQVFMFGRMVGCAPAGLAGLRRDARDVRRSASRSRCPAEQHGSQVLRDSGVNITQGHGQSGGNMSDKEVRFGIANTSLWAIATTNASNGSVNGGHDALTATGGAVPIVNMFTGEVIFGGVGSGLYGMFFYILIAVFVAGLMVGPHARVPRQEDRGAGDQARRDRRALRADDGPRPHRDLRRHGHGLASIFNPGAHGFSEALYAYDSQSNNNGSAFAGYGATEFSALARHGRALARPVRAAHRRARARRRARREEDAVPASAGTFRTDGATFAVLLVGVILLTAGLMIFPALTLGPIVEALS